MSVAIVPNDYTDIAAVKAMLGGTSRFTPGEDDTTLTMMITALSRRFDRETGHTVGFWSQNTSVTRRYGGTGMQVLDIDEYDAITAVTMSSRVDRSDALNLPLVPLAINGYTYTPNDVIPYPLNNPPYNQIFILRGFYPDAFHIGNVAVTGMLTQPPEVRYAVTLWVVYSWKAKNAGWADLAARADGPGFLYRRSVPPDVKEIIDSLRDTYGGAAKVAIVAGGDDPRAPNWIGWRTAT